MAFGKEDAAEMAEPDRTDTHTVLSASTPSNAVTMQIIGEVEDRHRRLQPKHGSTR